MFTYIWAARLAIRVYNNDGGTLILAWSSLETDYTRSVAWGDWDGDGDLDLAVGNMSRQDRVYNNNGGTLSLAWSSPTSGSTSSVGWGDWDGDGDLDLAVNNSIYTNKGGSLALAWSSPESYSARSVSVAWGDWDNDGKLDLGVASNGINRVYSNNVGNLILAWSSLETDPTSSVAWGDWDSDGDLDLAIGNSGKPNSVYSNNSDSLTLDWFSYNRWDPTSSVAWGDWDNDGDLDLAVGNSGEPNRIYRNSDGTLTLAWSSSERDRTRSVAWGDWDNDGDLDLAVGNGLSPGQQNRVYSNSGGTLTLAWSSSESDSTRSIAWGDWDNDGDLDLAAGNYGEPNRVYTNNGGILTLAWSSSESDSTRSIAWGDWDNDGDLDLAVGNYGELNRIYDNSDGNLTLAWSSPESGDTTSLAWGDWDGDGDLDLAVGNSGEPNHAYNNDSGNLTLSWSSLEADNTLSVAWGDWDSDGDLDLAVGNGGANRVYRNNNVPLSLIWVSPEANPTESVAWGDWDSDDDLDLAVGDYYRNNQVYSNNNGNLPLAWLSPEYDSTSSVAWGDWDGDGDLDLAVGNNGQPNYVYSNNGDSLTMVWSSPETSATSSVAWGDWDGDGDLDLAVGNRYGQSNQVYSNNNGNLSLAWAASETDDTSSVAWGDWDGDGDLDLAVGNIWDSVNRVYRNDGGNLSLAWSSTESDATHSIAWGDWDSDGDLDLAVGNYYRNNRVYSNNDGTLTLAWLSAETDNTSSVAWGDWDNDGDLDLAVGNKSDPNRIYENNDGTLSLAWSSSETVNNTSSVAWGDWNNDGGLDLAVGNYNNPNYVYTNYSTAQVSLENTPITARLVYPAGAASAPVGTGIVLDGPVIPINYTLHDPEKHMAASVSAFFSLDGGSSWQPAVAATGTTIRNLRSTSLLPIFFEGFEQSGAATYNNATTPVAVSGVSGANFSSSDPAGRLRTQAGAGFYRTGSHAATLDRVPSGTTQVNNLEFTIDLSAYDINRDDIVLDFSFMHHGEESHPNDRVWVRGSIADSWVELVNLNSEQGAPGVYVDLADLNISAVLRQAGQTLSQTFQLRFGQEDDFPAVTTTDSDGVTFDDIRLRLAPIEHTYYWDVYASGVFGASNNVVFRLNVHQGSSGVTPIMYAVKSTRTAPFRLRGSQVRVMDDANQPVANAVVYRQPDGQIEPYIPYYSQFGQAFRTNPAGYLQGYGEIAVGDELVVTVPVTETDDYTVYHTSATPTQDGLAAYTVSALGVQTLTVSADRPLLALNLDMSLEWDARQDSDYLDRLQQDIERASAILYDLSNGQVALGEVTVYQNKEQWDEADVLIYADNSVRPSATLGGIVSEPLTETLKSGESVPWAYLSGRIHMPPTWNRYGRPDGTIGEDWPRVLAHEIGHYALFLLDNYIGLDDNGFLTTPDCLGSAMTDAYRQEYSEFLSRTTNSGGHAWSGECLQTVAERTTGRSDWETIRTFYPYLKDDVTTTGTGPLSLPLAVTQIEILTSTAETEPLSDPYIYLTDESGQAATVQADRTDGYLFDLGDPADPTDDRVSGVGTPNGNLLLARGLRAGQRVCVYESTTQNNRQGCLTAAANNSSLTLSPVTQWAPQIEVRPVTSVTLGITVTPSFTPTEPLAVQIYPSYRPTTTVRALTSTLTAQGNGVYAAQLEFPMTILHGHVRVWAGADDQTRETISPFLITPRWDGNSFRAWGGNSFRAWGGNSFRAWGGNSFRAWGGNSFRAWGGNSFRAWGAPIMSADGQVMLFNTADILGGSAAAVLQEVNQIPNLPSWLTPIGQAYRYRADGPANDAYVIQFQYLERELPLIQEQNLRLYHYNPDTPADGWARLDTQIDDFRNRAAAKLNGPGIYALMATVELPPFQTGWNLFGYPIEETRPITNALISIEDSINRVDTYDSFAGEWQSYDYTVEPPFDETVNSLHHLEFGQGYWLYATEPVTGYLGIADGTNRVSSFEPPPGIYYGWITPTADFQPAVGTPVTAEIDGTLCGETTVGKSTADWDTRSMCAARISMSRMYAAGPVSRWHSALGAR